jgi:hypothetical protein
MPCRHRQFSSRKSSSRNRHLTISPPECLLSWRTVTTAAQFDLHPVTTQLRRSMTSQLQYFARYILPSAASDTVPPPSKADIVAAIRWFVRGSAGGPDGLRSQHLKYVTSAPAGNAGHRLLIRVIEFANLGLTGRVPAVIQPVFCGASLCALNKKDGGIRSIAVGSSLRRLVAKAACKAVMTKMTARFLPVQLGFGVPRACTKATLHVRTSRASNPVKVS